MTGLLATSAGLKALSLFSGAIGYVAVATAAAGATYWVTSRGFETTIAKLEASRSSDAATAATKALAVYVSDVATLHDAAQIFRSQQKDFTDKLSDINAAFDQISHASPLPVSCKPDAKRLRSLEDAIDTANRAISAAGAKPSPALPKPGLSKPH